MDELTSAGIAALLQRGIAAARAGRSPEARALLEKVVALQPDNEMAWLWLSGLMATKEQKRACLERVLQANPENIYARAGLERLQGTFSPAEEPVAKDVLEARLAAVVGGRGAKPASHAPRQTRPKLKRLGTPPPRKETGSKSSPEPQKTVPASEPSHPASRPETDRPICPACDRPVSLQDRRCPHCYLPFFSPEELLERGAKALPPPPTQPLKRARKGILGLLGILRVP